jgi:hypothetical protein
MVLNDKPLLPTGREKYPSPVSYGSVQSEQELSFNEGPFTLSRTRFYMLFVFFSACFMQVRVPHVIDITTMHLFAAIHVALLSVA